MSAVWVFQQFATAIGRERELEYLRTFRYGSATFEHDVTNFWLNGDLQISPLEEVAFLRRMFAYDLPVDRAPHRHGEGGPDDAAREVRERDGRARLRAALAGGHDRPRQERQRDGERRAGELAGRRARDRRAAVRLREPRARGKAGTLGTTAGADLALRVLNTIDAAQALRRPRGRRARTGWSSCGRRGSRRSASTRRTRIPGRADSAVSRRSRPSTRARAARRSR